ncbi:MAG: hypothetical protein C0598_06815 [Marinilabiliales bacterium]|nr:MAG: hypothetical protein C0598_06815 [Marinilabiliales bacterium]
MKKIIIILVVLFSVGNIMAQANERGRGQRSNKNRESKNQNCVNSINSELIKQQQEFYAVLSEADREKAENLKIKLKELRASRSDSDNVMDTRAIRDDLYKIRKEAEQIADNYPEQSKIYAKEISSLQYDNRNYKRNSGKGRNVSKNRMNRIQDPAWLLLWDENMAQSISSKRSQRNAMRVNNMRFMKDIPVEAVSYAKENIFPVVSEKRKAFDKNLSDEEKKEIETARGMIMSREAMVKNWRESEDFVPGQRRNDPAFDSFREQMQKSMQSVRKIAIEHNDEIQAVFNDLKPQREKWRADMKKIMSENSRGVNKRNFKVGTEEMRFLLINPEISETLRFF